eukprot:101024-Prymnesium_polylepis.1
MRARLLPGHLRRSDDDDEGVGASNRRSRACSHVVLPACVVGALVLLGVVVVAHSVAGVLPADLAVLLMMTALVGGGAFSLVAGALAQLWCAAAPRSQPLARSL